MYRQEKYYLSVTLDDLDPTTAALSLKKMTVEGKKEAIRAGFDKLIASLNNPDQDNPLVITETKTTILPR